MCMKITFVVFFILLLLNITGCGHYHYIVGKTLISPGMNYNTVYGIMGKPYLSFGLPQKCSNETSWLYYKVPSDKYLIINFVGFKVDDPPISVEDRSVLVF